MNSIHLASYKGACSKKITEISDRKSRGTKFQKMNLTKTALLLAITAIGLLGAMHHYLNSATTDDIIHEIKEVLPDLAHRYRLFKEWMKEHRMMFGVGEIGLRFAIWNKAYDFAIEHNAKGLSWTCGVNQFSHLTKEEFSALYLGYNWDPSKPRENVKILDEHDVSNDIDWRDKGAITPVRNQGKCGSCFAFAAASALESLYKIKKGKLYTLSVSQLLDCTSSYGNEGCNGGEVNYCFKYTRDKGIMQESDYPYVAKEETCKFDSSKVVFKNTGYINVRANDPNQLKSAVSRQPVTIAIQADESAFQQYKSGIISSNCGTKLNHAINIVGYSSTYWIVRNSWGDSWGEQGYGRIAIGKQNNGRGVCGINMSPSYPTLQFL